MSLTKIAANVSGIQTDPMAGLNHLKELSKQKNAEDKEGTFTAIVEILILSFCISMGLYSITLTIFPSKFQQWYREKRHEMSLKITGATKEDQKASRDLFDILIDLIKYAFGGVGLGGASYLYIKRKNKAGKQRQMELAMEEEMNRLKKALEEESKDSAAGVKDNKSSILNGINIVELFNCFADIMAIQRNLPREKDETALEYFMKISKSVNFPDTESLKAAKYFDDELYGKKQSTKDDRASFMQLLLKMMNTINTKSSARIAA